MNTMISIDTLIEIVRAGGKVKTGVDVFNSKGTLLLEKDIVVDTVRLLEIVKTNGVNTVPLNTAMNGGLWDSHGNLIQVSREAIKDIDDTEILIEPTKGNQSYPEAVTNEIEMRLLEIEEIKKQAAKKYDDAKTSIKKVLADIKRTGGEFDFEEVETNVSELVDFLVVADNPFSYLTQEIFS
ncbi:MAG: diguanylate cyclase, partial [Desulfobacula sp.]